jgi:Mg-chelatase subunit ChlD
MKRLVRSLLLAGSFVSTFSGFLLIACGSNESSSSKTDSGGTDTGTVAGGAGTGLDVTAQGGGIANNTNAAAPATGDDNCGTTTTELTKKPADLLLVLDRSSSMTRAMDSSEDCDANATNCAQRWATMISSLSTVLSTSPSDVYWGLKFFTTPAAQSTNTGRGGSTNTNRCYVSSSVEVTVAPGNAETINSQITQAGTSSSTPTRLAIAAAVTYLDTLKDTNPKYILLATDGEPNCAPGATDNTASDLAATTTAVQDAAAAGYKVFVIGVGPEAANLTALAQAGGTDHFYSASTPEELSSALSTIVGTVAAGCTYPLTSAVSNPNTLGVYLDKALVPQNSTDGWSLDGSNTTVTFNGNYCNDLTSGKKKLVEIFLPCKPTDPLPPIIQ